MSDETAVSHRQHVAEAISSVWWIILLRGILLLILGAYALFRPKMTLVALTQVVGIFAIADGIVAVVAGLLGWTESRGWTIVRGVVGIVIGVFVISHSLIVAGITAMVVMFILAVQSIAAGILEIVVAIRQRKEMEGEGWLILGGALSILFGLILATVPLIATAVFIRVLGVFTILFGISLIVLSFRVKSLSERVSEILPAVRE